MRLNTWGIILISTLFASGCAVGKNKKKQEILEIRLDYEAGMMPLHYSIFINESAGKIEYSKTLTSTQTVAMEISAAEWVAIADLLKKHTYKKISTYRMDKVYDRGGFTLTVLAPPDTIRIVDTQQFFVNEEFKADFDSISHYLRTFTEQKTGLDL